MDTHAVKPAVNEHGIWTAPSRLVDLARSVKRRAVVAFEGAMHGRRKTAACARLVRAGPVRSVLFLCHGNVCRSSYAEFALRRLAQRHSLEVSVESAGFVGANREPPQHALEVAGRRGLDMSAHRSRVLTQSMLDASALVVVMQAAQARAIRRHVRGDRIIVLGDVDPQPINGRTIRDPWNADISVFESSYDRIDRCLDVMIELLGVGKYGLGP